LRFLDSTAPNPSVTIPRIVEGSGTEGDDTVLVDNKVIFNKLKEGSPEIGV